MCFATLCFLLRRCHLHTDESCTAELALQFGVQKSDRHVLGVDLRSSQRCATPLKLTCTPKTRAIILPPPRIMPQACHRPFGVDAQFSLKLTDPTLRFTVTTDVCSTRVPALALSTSVLHKRGA